MIKFHEILNELISTSPFKSNRKPIWQNVGVTSAALSQYTHGDARPRLETLVALADFFGVSLDYLVLGRETSRNDSKAVEQLAAQLEQATSEIQQRSDQHNWTVWRVAQTLASQIDDAVKSISDMPAPSGFIGDQDLLVLEQNSSSVRLLVTHLDYNVTSAHENALPGLFARTVAANLASNPPRTYEFLLPTRVSKTWRAQIQQFRKVLKSHHDVSDADLRKCKFRLTNAPVFSGCVIHVLDIPGLKRNNELLFDRIKDLVDAQSRFGYTGYPNRITHGDIAYDIDHLQLAVEAFDELWRNAQPI